MLPVPRISALAPDCAKTGWVGRRGVGPVASRQPTASSMAAMVVETRANNGVRWKGYIVASRLEWLRPEKKLTRQAQRPRPSASRESRFDARAGTRKRERAHTRTSHLFRLC